mmetsp:Transcript_91076/g.260597  ORF Transcript_91076/g.260597 Transcript_91076/m.260597 type:complete len:259 (+) Transcript_91076:1622-2398(+)
MFLWTNSLLMAQHVWPLLKNAPRKTPSTAFSISTSSRMIAASLPPSSSSIRLKSLAHAAITLVPTEAEPVNTTLRTSGCAVKTSPGLGLSSSDPTTTFSTPDGRIFRSISPIRSVVRGVCGAGFSTTVLPQASAQAVGFQPRMMGAFQGAMMATTPMGLCRITTFFSSSSEITSSWFRSSFRAALSKVAAATKSSMRVSAMGRPLSLVCSVAKASVCSRSTFAHADNFAARSAVGIAAQALPALCAAFTAASSCFFDT